MVRICAFGAASQDVFIAGKGIQSRLDPASNEYVEEFPLGAKLTVDSVIFASGGGATNAAVTFARQGLESHFVGMLGHDMAASAVLAELDQENVSTAQVQYDPRLGTQYSTILLANSGERTILVYRGAAHAHKAQTYVKLDLHSFDWIYVSSFAGNMDALHALFENAAQSGCQIAFNPGEAELAHPDKLKGLLSDVAVLLVNKEEAKKIVDGETAEELIIHAARYVKTVIISDGPDGVYATDSVTMVRAGMYEDVPVKDRTGAGDAFGSGFLSQWAQGKSLADSIVFASANSTSVIQQIGAKAGILPRDVILHAMPLHEQKIKGV